MDLIKNLNLLNYFFKIVYVTLIKTTSIKYYTQMLNLMYTLLPI